MDKNEVWTRIRKKYPGYFWNRITTVSLNDALKNTEDIDVYLEMLLSQKGGR